MKYERGSFITVGSRDTLRGLHPTAQALYMWLSSYANETGNCFPSRKTLAEDVGCVERTIDSMLDLLRENGLIEVKGRKDGDKQLSNLYKVLIVPPLAGDATPPSIKCPTPLQEMPTNSIHLTQTTEGGVAIAPPFIEVIQEEERPAKRPKAKYTDARTAFSWLPNRQESWENDLTQLNCGLLLFKRGEEAVRKFVKYVQFHQDDDGWNYNFTKPSDYERKWEDIKAYAKRNR